jgi:hypothetical protein
LKVTYFCRDGCGRAVVLEEGQDGAKFYVVRELGPRKAHDKRTRVYCEDCWKKMESATTPKLTIETDSSTLV